MRDFLRQMITTLLVGIVCAGVPVLAEDSIEVVLATEFGDIRIALDRAHAPLSSDNFLSYVDDELYDGATFYRTVRYDNDNGEPKIEVIQGGLGDAESRFAPIAHEDTEQTGIRHTDGVISMARGALGTASSEFFICIGDQPGLDKGQSRNADQQGFAAFGRVVDGMDVVRKIHASPSDAAGDSAYVSGQMIEQPVRIKSIRRATQP